jgi:hemerythrin
MRLEWSAKHRVNVKEIDEQHKYFIGLINEMFEALERREVESVVDDTLNQLAAYAQFHFATEEKLMARCGYEGLEEQKALHAALMNRLAELLDERQVTLDIYKYYYDLLDFLKDWLLDHLLIEDKKFGQCMNDHGIF